MDNLKIGSLITTPQQRDAVHICVAPVVAGERLFPGQPIAGLRDGKAYAAQDAINCIGIVDPFLALPIYSESQFWLFLKPGSIQSLRHHWEHPEMPEEGAAAEAGGTVATVIGPTFCSPSEKWLRDFASDVGLSYDALMHGASGWVNHEDRLYCGPLLDGETVPEEFWPHYEAVIGFKVDENKKYNFFSCSC